MDDRQIVRYPRSGTCSLRGSVCPGGGTPILDLTGMLVVTFRGLNCGSSNF